MNINDTNIISNMSKSKAELTENNPKKFILRAIMAGFYLIIAIILSYTVGALTEKISVELSKIAVAMTFSIALALICFLGGELFTGNNLVMAIGYYDKKVKFKSVLKVWCFTYLGNLIGNIILGFIFITSGSGSDMFPKYLAQIVNIKVSIPMLQLIFRAILCNFIVCIAVLSSVKMKSEIAKMTTMFWLIFAFVIAGFEHSIANMGIFTLSYFTLGTLPWSGILYSMLCVTIGNIVGGAVLYGGTLYLMKTDK